MILNIIILWVLILILSGVLWFLYKWYKQEQQEQDERILQLEKRLEDYKKQNKKLYDELVYGLQTRYEEIFMLQKRVEKLERKRTKKSDKNEL